MPAAVVLEAMGVYAAAVDAVASQHVGAASAYPANLAQIVEMRGWPPTLVE